MVKKDKHLLRKIKDEILSALSVSGALTSLSVMVVTTLIGLAPPRVLDIRKEYVPLWSLKHKASDFKAPLSQRMIPGNYGLSLGLTRTRFMDYSEEGLDSIRTKK